MTSAEILNPLAAHVTVDDYRTGQDALGADLSYYRKIHQFRANAAIEKGECLMSVAATATVPLSVTPMTAAIAGSDPWAFMGAALAPAAAGDLVPVCMEGFCVVQHDTSDTPADLSLLLLPDATTGDFAIDTAAAAGEGVVGKVLGPEIASTETCWVYIGWVAVLTVIDTDT